MWSSWFINYYYYNITKHCPDKNRYQQILPMNTDLEYYVIKMVVLIAD